ncbi:MAG: alkaline phosphatase family protein [Tissierellia bacterium]|nr:alkaline phosphatase family protein [Tissierellia bacterium]
MKKNNVLLVSIDAVKPDILFHQEKYGLQLNTLNSLMEKGSYTVKGNTSVFPSFTYCAHQSIITGCHPEKHKIYTNKLFDPKNHHMDAWYWYVNKNVPTLWEEAKRNGYFTINLGFPTSVMAKTDLNIPEYWRDTTDYDSEILQAVSTPQGLSAEFEAVYNKNIPCGKWDLKDDETKLEQCLWLLDTKVKNKVDKPIFMTTYFASYDDLAHNVGTYHPKALSYLQKTDDYLGVLIQKMKEIFNDQLIICVISDHGMMDNIGDVYINHILYKNGLIQLTNQGQIEETLAYCQRSGGVGLIKTKNKKIQDEVYALLVEKMKQYPHIITQVMTGMEAEKSRHGCGGYDLIVTTAPGWEVREDCTKGFIREIPSQRAQHGYDENCDDMKAIFVIAGKNIPKQQKIEGHSIIDIAPTLAHLMGFTMKSAQGVNMLS